MAFVSLLVSFVGAPFPPRRTPSALGAFVAFLLTVVTVPLVERASIFRGWADEDVDAQLFAPLQERRT